MNSININNSSKRQSQKLKQIQIQIQIQSQRQRKRQCATTRLVHPLLPGNSGGRFIDRDFVLLVF